MAHDAASVAPSRAGRVLGRYVLYEPIASGGMATVHLGRLIGPVGFTRTVAIKRLHPQFASDPEFVAMFLDEARVAGRISHPNVVQALDVVALDGELFLVMDFVQGQSVFSLLRNGQQPIEPDLACSVMIGALTGLHAAHETNDEYGRPLSIVHRDISPQNVLVGIDGIARVVDFGVARALGRSQTTRAGQIKGKLSYLAPEQLDGHATRRTDVYAAAIVLWEMLTGRRLFAAETNAEVLRAVQSRPVEPPSRFAPGVSSALDAIVLCALDRDPDARFATAKELSSALEAVTQIVAPSRIGAWVKSCAPHEIDAVSKLVAEIESDSLLAASLITEASVEAPTRSRRLRSIGAGLALATALLLGSAGATKLKAQPRVQAGPAEAPASAPESPAAATLFVTAPAPAQTPALAARQPAPPHARPAPARRSTPIADCAVPYSFDDRGVKHLKTQCL